MKRKTFLKLGSMGISSAFLSGTIIHSGSGTSQGESEEFFDLFQNPPAGARPFMRWWWNGNRVTEKELLRELDLLKEAGIGGVEINPIALPKEADEVGQKPLTWLTPEWNRMVKVVAEGARERGMITDMIVGTGWPFGGRFLPPEEQIKGVVLQKFELKGPMTFQRKLDEMIELKRKPDKSEKAPTPKLLFLRMAPADLHSMNEIIDLTDRVNADRIVRFEVPKGDHILCLGTIQIGSGFNDVNNGAPGGNGPCLDHYNRAAVKRYINRVSNKLGPQLGGVLGNALKALFVDSIELAGSDWTNDMLEQFKKRRGYSLAPYYPFVFYDDPGQGYDDLLKADGVLTDTIKRVRYDYNQTLVELFQERFIETYHAWCHQQKAQSRYQAYGTPWLMGMSEGYMIPDIPESNNWLFSPNPYKHGYYVWNQYTSAGAHLTGKPTASSEAMTNTRGVFKATLEMIKQADDMNFIAGINHSVLHGFNYSPPEAGFPGWVRFGTYFSEQNTWWPYFHHWINYNARLSAIFQHSQPVVDIAILTPRSDIWRTTGLAREQLQTQPWYGPRLWESIQQNGLCADYISEMVIQKSTKSAGYLKYGSMSYQTLVLTGVRSLLPKTAQAIRNFAEAGGRIIFIDKQPSRSPSLVDTDKNDDLVHNNIQKILNSHPDRVKVVPAPDRGTPLHSWMQHLITQFSIDQPVRISKPDPALYQMRQQKGVKDIYFFVNNDKKRMLTFEATFQTAEKTPWQWDPMTGKRSVYPYEKTKNKLDMQLQPLESLLLVFEKDLDGAPQNKSRVNRSKSMVVDGPWECTFQHARGGSFSRNLPKLIDLSQSQDSKLSSFAGTIHYQTTFIIGKSIPQMLDLGEVHGVAEVSLNGNSLGTEWWGRRQFNIADVVQQGENRVDIKVTTVLYNYMKSLKEDETAQKWVQAQRNLDLVSAGMLGPVEISKLE